MLGRRDVPDDVREEVRFHLEARTQELIAQGQTPEAAAAQARSEFGDVSAARQELTAIDAGSAARSASTSGFLPMLGVAPALGAAFDRSDDVAPGTAAVVLSHGFWIRRFGGSPDAVGKSLRKWRAVVFPDKRPKRLERTPVTARTHSSPPNCPPPHPE